MLRVRLLTYHFSDNFGALLQAYALRKWFQVRGHDAAFINYHPSYVEEGGAFDAPFNPGKWRKNATILYMKSLHLRRSLLGDGRQAHAFAKFRHDLLGVTGPRIKTAQELATLDPGDMLVCGSDQIWGPSLQRGLDPVYFLSFHGAERARRIAYAPSFGQSQLDTVYHDEAGRLIRTLDGLSVREASGIDIIRNVSGRGDAICVPDPTLLLGDFSELLPNTARKPRDYIFCYALRAGQPIGQVAREVGSVLSMPIFSPYNVNRRWSEIGETIYPSPTEWLQTLNDASFVVSNSFHGVALSIVQKRPFLAVALPGRKGELTDRLRSLLGQLNLTHRLIEDFNRRAVREVLADPINWRLVDERLVAMRASAEQYLISQMAEANRGVNAVTRH